jgi:hypothetical protein
MSIICIIVLYYERHDLTSRAVRLRHLYVTSGMGLRIFRPLDFCCTGCTYKIRYCLWRLPENSEGGVGGLLFHTLPTHSTKCLAWFRQSVVVGYFLLCCIYGRSGIYQRCLYDGSPPTATQIQDVCAYDKGFGLYKFELHAFRPLPSAAWHCTTEEISFG